MNKMHLAKSIREGFERYFDFSGRTSRATFWDWVLFVFFTNLAAAILDGLVFNATTVNFGLIPSAGTPLFELAIYLLLLFPNLTMMTRRLRDAGLSPFWVLLVLLPGVGLIILLIMSTQRGPEDKKPSEIF